MALLAVKNVSRLSHGVTSKHNSDCYCLNCFHSFRTESKLKSHDSVCENHNYCNVKMPLARNKILKFNQGHKSMNSPGFSYVDTEYLLDKVHTCDKNPKTSN